MQKPRIRVKAGSSGQGAIRGMSSGRAYDAARSETQELVGWNPALSAAADEVLGGRDRVTARARDLVRNNSWAAGGLDKRVDAVVGADMWLSLKPMWRALGQTQEWAATWASDVEMKFKMWAEDPTFTCDVERALTWGGMIRLAYSHWVVDAESLAVIYYLPVADRRYGTCFKIVDPDRLCNMNNAPDSVRLRGGVEMDRHGAAVAYHIQAQHPNAEIISMQDSQRWSRVPRFTRMGRSNVVHAFRKDRAGQMRGISRLASALKRFKMLDRYDTAELNAAVLSAMIPMFIKSNAGSSVGEALAPMGDEAATNMDNRAAFHEESNITFNSTRIPVLYDGEEIDSVDTKRPSGNFPAFEAAVLRSVAPAFGLTYEQISSDWGNVNYSSARAALIEIWRGMMADRLLFTRQFVTPIFTTWLEEAILRGDVVLPAGAPSFYEARAAYTACEWIGPGRGWVDPVKEADAAVTRMAAGLSTLEAEAAEQGNDYRDILDARARIRSETIAAGLPDPEMAAMPPKGPQPYASDAPSEQEPARKKEPA